MSNEERRRNLELFHEELADQLALLNRALVALEQDPAAADAHDTLMRAAHTIKGAARMVGLAPIEQLLHAIEDLIQRALGAGRSPDSSSVDLLFSCFDRLEAINGAEADTLPERLAQQAGELDALAVRVRAEADAQATSPTLSARDEASSSSPPADLSGERVVRLDALQLNRIAALAGESMVAARWLQPYADALQQLRSRQRELGELIARSSPQADAASTALIRSKERQCQELLQERLEELEAFARRANTVAHRLYGEVLNANMRPFHEGLGGLPRLVRDLAASLGKRVRLEIVGRNTLVDRDILRRLEAPITHCVRNAIDHGLETPEQRRMAGKPEQGLLRLEAMHRGGMLSISVRDDGAGIDLEAVRRRAQEAGLLEEAETNGDAGDTSEAELLELLLRPGFSTATAVSEVSGRGVGLDVAQAMAREVGGSLRLNSSPGGGTTVHFQLPLTLSVVRTLLVRIGGEPYAVPLARLDQIVAAPHSSIGVHEGRASLQLDGRAIGLIQAQLLLGQASPPALADPLPVLVLSEQGRSYGLVVEGFLGEQDLVVRPLDPRLGRVSGISAAALLGDGAPILVIDVGELLTAIEERLALGPLPPLALSATASPSTSASAGTSAADPVTGSAAADTSAVPSTAAPLVLVVDDSRMVRESLARSLTGRGYRVLRAADGLEALELLRSEPVDLVVSDVEMPGLDGFALVRRLRELPPPVGGLPVLIVSSRDSEADRLAGLEAGADRYLPKGGFSEATLLEAVHDLIGPA